MSCDTPWPEAPTAQPATDVKALRDLLSGLADEPDLRPEDCKKCEDAQKDLEKKCNETRKKVAYALRQAGCPSIVKAYKGRSAGCTMPSTTSSGGCSTGTCQLKRGADDMTAFNSMETF